MGHMQDINDLSTLSVSSTFVNNNTLSMKNNSFTQYFDNVSLTFFYSLMFFLNPYTVYT